MTAPMLLVSAKIVALYDYGLSNMQCRMAPKNHPFERPTPMGKINDHRLAEVLERRSNDTIRPNSFEGLRGSFPSSKES